MYDHTTTATSQPKIGRCICGVRGLSKLGGYTAQTEEGMRYQTLITVITNQCIAIFNDTSRNIAHMNLVVNTARYTLTYFVDIQVVKFAHLE